MEKLLEFTKISPTQVMLANILVYRETVYKVIIVDKQCSLSISSCEQSSSFSFQLNLNANNAPITLELDAQAVSLFLPGNSDNNAVKNIPHDLLMGSLHYSLDSTLQQLSQFLNIPVTLTGGEAITNNDLTNTGMILTANFGGTLYSARLLVNDTVLSLLDNLPRSSNSNSLELSVLAGLDVGRATLSRKDLDNLEIGDVVFLQQHVTGEHLILRLSKDISFLAEAEGGAVTIKQRLPSMEDEQSSEVLEEQGAPGGVDLSDISVTLLFELGEKQFNANELKDIKPGFVFELDRSIEQPVRVRVNGKVIGKCKLVQIDNRLGAKITELNN